MTDKKALEVLESWLRVAYQNADGTDEDSAELFEALQTIFSLINRQQAEIERLQNKVEELSDVLSDTIRIRYAEAKTEAIKDFVHEIFSPFAGKAYLSKRDLEIIVEHLAKYY